MANQIVNLPTADAADLKRMHHQAADELLEQALSMLSFMALCGEHEDGDDFSMHGGTIAGMTEAIVEKLRQAQKHHRESL